MESFGGTVKIEANDCHRPVSFHSRSVQNGQIGRLERSRAHANLLTVGGTFTLRSHQLTVGGRLSLNHINLQLVGTPFYHRSFMAQIVKTSHLDDEMERK